MASAEIVNQEQASFAALTLVYSHFDKEIDAYMQSLLYSGMDAPNLEDGIRRTQAFQNSPTPGKPRRRRALTQRFKTPALPMCATSR